MFIKHGDGKIISVVDGDEDLTDEQKKSVKKMSQQVTPQPEKVDSSDKKSGR